MYKGDYKHDKDDDNDAVLVGITDTEEEYGGEYRNTIQFTHLAWLNHIWYLENNEQIKTQKDTIGN